MVSSSKIKSVVFYRKIPRDLTEALLSSFGLSILAAFLMIYLFGLRFVAFMAPLVFGRVTISSSAVYTAKEIAVVSLFRHFGCPCCWELASALKEAKARFNSADMKLIAIGVGGPDKAQILAERLPFPMDCLYADPERKICFRDYSNKICWLPVYFKKTRISSCSFIFNAL